MLFLCLNINSQEPGIPGFILEEYLQADEKAIVPDEILEGYADYIRNPVNLNGSTTDELEETGLFTPFQVYSLIKYRETYGELFSIYELNGLPGFRLSRLQAISPFITAAPVAITPTRNREMHHLIFNIGKSYPEARGYEPENSDTKTAAYSGSPVTTCLRIKTGAGRNFTTALTYEKDGGERMFSGSTPAFLTGFATYRGKRIVRQLVVGSFRLNHGLGLINGTGFLHSPEHIMLHPPALSVLRPYASKREAGFDRGIACRLGSQKTGFLLWSSFKTRDLSINNILKDPESFNWLDQPQSSGLHRTNSEMEGRGLGYRFHSGMQVLYRHKQVTAGSMIGVERLGMSHKGRDSFPVHPGPLVRYAFSLHGSWYRKEVGLFGELAFHSPDATAFLAGAQFQSNDYIQGLLLIHHYGKTYRGLLPSTYSSGSTPCGESGVAIQLHAEPGIWLSADATCELFGYPAPRYLTRVPSVGTRCSITFNSPGNSNLQWSVRIQHKKWQATPASAEAGLPPLVDYSLLRMDGRIHYRPGARLEWQSRLVASVFSGNRAPSSGYAGLQQVRFTILSWLRVTIQWVVFHVKDWNNRIYLYEPGLYYDFRFPAYYGTGQKTTVVLTTKTANHVILAGKLSGITYTDREVLGTGSNQVPGNRKVEVGIQVRVKL